MRSLWKSSKHFFPQIIIYTLAAGHAPRGLGGSQHNGAGAGELLEESYCCSGAGCALHQCPPGASRTFSPAPLHPPSGPLVCPHLHSHMKGHLICTKVSWTKNSRGDGDSQSLQYRSDAATLLVPERNLGSHPDIEKMNWGNGLAQPSPKRWGPREGTQCLLESWSLGSHKGRGLGFPPVLHLASSKRGHGLLCHDAVPAGVMRLCRQVWRWPPLSELWFWDPSASSHETNGAGLPFSITCIRCGLSMCRAQAWSFPSHQGLHALYTVPPSTGLNSQLWKKAELF